MGSKARCFLTILKTWGLLSHINLSHASGSVIPKGGHRTKWTGWFSFCSSRSSICHAAPTLHLALCVLEGPPAWMHQQVPLSSGFQLVQPMEVSSQEDREDGAFITGAPEVDYEGSQLLRGSRLPTATVSRLHHVPPLCRLRPRKGTSHLFPTGTLTQNSNSVASPLDFPWLENAICGIFLDPHNISKCMCTYTLICTHK